MGDFKRSSGRRPASTGYRPGIFSRGTDKPAGRYGARPAGRFGARPEGRFGRGEGRFGGRSEGRPRRDDSRPPLEMHEVICAKCGKKTEVPFKPTSSKPVYCRDCFTKKEDSYSRPERRERPTYSESDLEKINQKLDKIMKALKID